MNRPAENQYSIIVERLWRYGPLLAWLAFISFASTDRFSALNTSTIVRPLLHWLFPHLSEARIRAIHFLIRKVSHFTEYAILAFFIRRAFITSSLELLRRRWFELGVLLVITYALLDEFHQSFVPSRTASVHDTAIDAAGGLAVLIVFKIYAKRSKRLQDQDR